MAHPGPHILQARIHTVHATTGSSYLLESLSACEVDFSAVRSIEKVYCPPHKNTSGGKQKNRSNPYLGVSPPSMFV